MLLLGGPFLVGLTNFLWRGRPTAHGNLDTLSQNHARRLESPSQVLFQPLAIHFFLVQCRQRNVYSMLMSCPCLTGLNCAWHGPGVGRNRAGGKDSRNVLRIKRFLLTQVTPWMKICHLKSSLLPRSVCLSHFLAPATLLWHFLSRNKEKRESVVVEELNPWMAKVRSLKGLHAFGLMTSL